MLTHRKNRSREKVFLLNISTKPTLSTLSTLFLSTATISYLLSALFSCTPMTSVMTKVSFEEIEYRNPMGYIDIFTFDNDRLMQLDSYMHYSSISGNSLNIRSQNGNKKIFICSNGQRTKAGWSSINSMAALDKVYVELTQEDRNAPCMTGMGEAVAGSGQICNIEMRRIASEVVLNSLRCDFTGKSYEGYQVSDVKVYLTNVNTRCRITAEGEITPLSIINSGCLESDDLETFLQPDLVAQSIPVNIGTNKLLAGICLLCYPNASSMESPGTPFTRLVIEGTLDGETYWWPIDINRGEEIEKPGIYRNTRYIFDVVLTRKGSLDPNKPIEPEDADIKMEVRKWEEKEDYQVSF